MKNMALAGLVTFVLLGALFLYFNITAEIERKDLIGRWCTNNGDYLILKEDGTFLTQDSIPHDYYRWALKGNEDPLGPALAIDHVLNGVFPLSRDAGRLIFVIDPDQNLFYIKCD
jgi:hypothetical protein